MERDVMAVQHSTWYQVHQSSLTACSENEAVWKVATLLGLDHTRCEEGAAAGAKWVRVRIILEWKEEVRVAKLENLNLIRNPTAVGRLNYEDRSRSSTGRCFQLRRRWRPAL
jgi:hypothetical protein